MPGEVQRLPGSIGLYSKQFYTNPFSRMVLDIEKRYDLRPKEQDKLLTEMKHIRSKKK